MSGGKADINDFNEIFAEIAKNEGFSPNYQVINKSTTNKGDGYIGLITFVELKDAVKNGKQVTLHLALKSAPKEDRARNVIGTRAAFIMESFMYWEVLENFRKYELKNGIKNPFDAVAKCYAVNNDEYKEVVVFENLREAGFQLKKRDESMNRKHLELILKEYGKYHAISLAMKNKQPEEFQKMRDGIKGNLLGNVLEQLGPAVKMTVDEIGDYMNKNGNGEAVENLKRHIQDVIKKILDDMNETDEFSVISHGDCWGNNFMFKYEPVSCSACGGNTTSPSAVKILDWQCSLYTSPAIDIGYFFWSCADPAEHKNHLEYLKFYHDSLCEHLSQFDAIKNAQEVFPFEELKKQWIKGIRFGTLMALLIYKSMLTTPEEAPDLTDMENMEAMYFKIARNDEYLAKCEKLIVFMHENDLMK